jgi:hypothetical protein
MELLNGMAGITMQHVPYRSSGQRKPKDPPCIPRGMRKRPYLKVSNFVRLPA